MAARPTWKGLMRLSLVSFGIKLFPAIASGRRIAFNMIDRKTGERIREKRVAGEREVEAEEIARGYEYEKGRYLLVEDEDLDRIKLESRKAVELYQFFDAAEIDPIYFDKPYWVAPDGPVAEEAFAVVHEAMARSGRAALGRLVLSGHERQVAVVTKGIGFALHTLHAHDVVRGAETAFEDYRPPPVIEDEIEVAESLIARKTAPFDPTQFVDRYQQALTELIREKLRGATPPIAEAPRPARVVNLMDALKRSLREEGGDRPETPKRKRRAPGP